MGKLFYLLLFSVMSINTYSQEAINWDKVVVRDSTGNVYPTAVWQRLAQTGRYQIQVGADRVSGTIRYLNDNDLPKPEASKFFTTGQKMRPFSVTDINGNKFTLAELTGKVVVVNFWFINCGPCRQEIPRLNEIVNNYANNKDVVFIALALDQKAELIQFLGGFPFNYHIVDNGGYLAQQNGVGLFPTHVIIDRKGNVLFHTSGLSISTIPWLRKSIEAALAGKEI